MLEKVSQNTHLARAREFLRTTGWLSERPNASRDLILGACRLVQFEAGEAVYRMGDDSDGLYGFVTGGLQVLVPGDDDEVIVVHRTEPGFWGGESAMLAKTQRLVSLATTQPTTGLHLTRKVMNDLANKHPELIHDFYSISHRNLATALRLLANLSVMRSEKRLALRLLHYEELYGESGGWLDLSQETLADLVAVSLPTLQRALRAFNKAGCVEVGYGRVRILSREMLIEFCND